ncbi:MAG: hypothetical protein J0I15_18340, partial [Herbaspirillum huttiense]|uniref:DUF6985 domain-containing protein n=1 Tax=Herbaspirillum huttiense TaxID=863372 RepID=UPI001ACEA224
MLRSHDDVFGDLEYQYGWTRPYTYPLFGDLINVKLIVPCDVGAEIEEEQREAFLIFDKKKSQLMLLAEQSLFDYYQRITDEYRSIVGVEICDMRCPKIENSLQLKSLIRPTEIVIQQSFGTGDRVVGVLFQCTWEPELGLAVKFVNEEVEEVGTQDIV